MWYMYIDERSRIPLSCIINLTFGTIQKKMKRNSKFVNNQNSKNKRCFVLRFICLNCVHLWNQYQQMFTGRVSEFVLFLWKWIIGYLSDYENKKYYLLTVKHLSLKDFSRRQIEIFFIYFKAHGSDGMSKYLKEAWDPWQHPTPNIDCTIFSPF